MLISKILILIYFSCNRIEYVFGISYNYVSKQNAYTHRHVYTDTDTFVKKMYQKVLKEYFYNVIRFLRKNKEHKNINI